MITLSTSNANPSKTKLDALLVALPAFQPTTAPWRRLGRDLSRLCALADPGRRFTGSEGSILTFPSLGQIAPAQIALVGLGKSTEPAALRRCLAKAIRQLHKSRKIRSLGILCPVRRIAPEILASAAEEGTYHFTAFSPDQKDTPQPLTRLTLFAGAVPQSVLTRTGRISSAVRYARNLANQPPNLFSPATLVAAARKLARTHRLRCEIWDQRRLQRDGFGGLLAVGQGSANPPRFIRLDYRGAAAGQPPFVVVGKAITFDTGGISIKPSDSMDEMKFDKCGGIAVLGIMSAVAALRLPINVTGLIASAENMPSATAYRPGDLIRALSGKYIEVLNTDAEGRIVLADALTYAQRLKPRAIVDLATLTGACIVCFGHECAAVLGNHDDLIENLRTAAHRAGEKIWPLPIWPEYREKVKSDIAFVKNTAGRPGGTITGACFLDAFVDAKIPWAHLDIAGVAWTSKEDPHRAKGATAFGVRLITHWLEAESEESR